MLCCGQSVWAVTVTLSGHAVEGRFCSWGESRRPLQLQRALPQALLHSSLLRNVSIPWFSFFICIARKPAPNYLAPLPTPMTEPISEVTQCEDGEKNWQGFSPTCLGHSASPQKGRSWVRVWLMKDGLPGVCEVLGSPPVTTGERPLLQSFDPCRVWLLPQVAWG